MTFITAGPPRAQASPTHSEDGFPLIDNPDVDYLRETFLDANSDNWPYFIDATDYDVAEVDYGSNDQEGRDWELSDQARRWLATNVNNWYAYRGLVLFENVADARRFRKEFGDPRGTKIYQYTDGGKIKRAR